MSASSRILLRLKVAGLAVGVVSARPGCSHRLHTALSSRPRKDGSSTRSHRMRTFLPLRCPVAAQHRKRLPRARCSRTTRPKLTAYHPSRCRRSRRSWRSYSLPSLVQMVPARVASGLWARPARRSEATDDSEISPRSLGIAGWVTSSCRRVRSRQSADRRTLSPLVESLRTVPRHRRSRVSQLRAEDAADRCVFLRGIDDRRAG